MRPEEGDLARLWDVADTCRAVLGSTEHVEFENFLADRDIRDLVVFRLILIGEAINKISERLKSTYPEVLWRAFIDQRNVLIHGYVEIDYERVWSTVNHDLPTLLGQVEGIMKSLQGIR
jgi:uncharacterized protein with HEPN domain